MNGDTIIVGARAEDTPRVKRVKRGRTDNGGYTAIRFKEHRFSSKSSKGLPNGSKATIATRDATAQNTPVTGHANGTALTESQDRNHMDQSSANAVIPAQKPSVLTNANTSAKAMRPRKLQIKHYAPPDKRGPATNGANVKPHARAKQTFSNSPIPHFRPPAVHGSELAQNTEVNFATAPDEPVEIAWWLAYQISHFDRAYASDPTINATSHHDLSAMQNNHADETSRAAKLDSEYVKEQARKRQQRWRASNRERSKLQLRATIIQADQFVPENLNDLRARVNRDAKQKFGAESTREKEAWIEEEFLKRRTKLEMKQRIAAAQLGQYPEFQVRAEIRNNMTAKDPSLSQKMQEVRKLVVDLLFPKDGKRTKAYLTRTAKSFISAMEESGARQNDVLKSVCKNIAGASEAMASIRGGLDEAEDNELDIATNAAKGRLQPQRTRKSLWTTVSDQPIPNEQATAQSARLMKAIDDAVAILARINDFPPQGAPQSNSRLKRKSHTATADAPSAGIDLDAFLETANAGPVDSTLVTGEDDEDADITEANDDETIDEPIEVQDGPVAAKSKTRSDSDIWNTIDHVIDQLVSKRITYEAKKGPGRRFPAQGQAQQARKLLADADLRTNFAMTKAKSEAISHLYIRLVGLLNSGSQSSAAPPPGPSTSSTNKQSEARPPVAKKPKVSLGKPKAKAPTATVTPRTLPPLPAKYDLSKLTSSNQFGARTEEEQRKIKSYGYPPLPGSKVGTPRHSL